MSNEQVIPFHATSTGYYLENALVFFCYRFDDVLDVEKLRAALARLFEIDGWRKMGGRVKRNAEGKLEYHVPTRYDESNPGFTWEHVTYNQRIEDHRIASKIPCPGGKNPRPSATLRKDLVDEMFTPQGCPKQINDWIETGAPPLTIRLVSFTNATLFTFTTFHSLFDGIAMSAWLDAWIAVLEKREQDLPTLIGVTDDLIGAGAKKLDPKSWLLHDQTVEDQWSWLSGYRRILDNYFWPVEERRLVRIPDAIIQKLRAEAIEEQKQFISDADILMALWSRTMVRVEGIWPSRPVGIMHPFSTRDVAGPLLPKEGTYLGVAVTASIAFLKASEFLNESLGYVALKNRKALKAQRTPESVGGYYAFVTQKGMKKATGSWDQLSMTLSNVGKSGFWTKDFSSAVVKPGKPLEKRPNGLGQPSFFQVTAKTQFPLMHNKGHVLGQDHVGDWWVDWAATPENWPKVEEALAQLGTES